MKKFKLSPAQIKVLRALAEPGAVAHHIHGICAYWFTSPVEVKGLRTGTIEKLSGLELIKIRKDSLGYDDTATITPAGREYLAGLGAMWGGMRE